MQHNKMIPSAVKGLDQTFRDDLELLRDQINQGFAKLWQIDNDSWMITRTETFPNRKPELVVCCYQGKNLRQVTDEIIRVASAQGFGSIRYHTQRKGLNRLLKGKGFKPMEVVYQRSL